MSHATYRHSVTGLVGVYDRRLGDNDPHLKEVEPDAKPLAYTPITPEAVATVLESRKSKNKSTEGSPRDKKEEE